MPKTPSRKPTGRPSKLTPEMQTKIVDALRSGNYREVVARFVGIAPSTLYVWLERGEADIEKRADLEAMLDEAATARTRANVLGMIAETETPYAELSEAATRAEAEAEIRAVANVHKAGSQDWRASAEYLRRKHRARWSTSDRLEIRGDHTVHGSVPVEIIPTEDQEAEIARLLAATSGNGDGP